MRATECPAMSKKQRRGTPLEESAVPSDPVRTDFAAIVFDPAPREALAVSMRCACDVCDRSWNFKATREVDGQIVPDQFRVFLASIGFAPKARKIRQDGRECIDLWPLPVGPKLKGDKPRNVTLADVLELTTTVNRWLCPSCWAEVVAEIGLELFLWQELDWRDRERAETYAARYADEETIEQPAQPSYAADLQDRAMRDWPQEPPFTDLAPEDEASLRREIEAYEAARKMAGAK